MTVQLPKFFIQLCRCGCIYKQIKLNFIAEQLYKKSGGVFFCCCFFLSKFPKVWAKLGQSCHLAFSLLPRGREISLYNTVILSQSESTVQIKDHKPCHRAWWFPNASSCNVVNRCRAHVCRNVSGTCIIFAALMFHECCRAASITLAKGAGTVYASRTLKNRGK